MKSDPSSLKFKEFIELKKIDWTKEGKLNVGENRKITYEIILSRSILQNISSLIFDILHKIMYYQNTMKFRIKLSLVRRHIIRHIIKCNL